jgi:ribonuclease P protein component
MSEAPGGLRPRLRRSDFLRATGAGRRFSSRHFLVFLRERADGGPTRLGITVTRKVGNAVRRNRIKRLVREWFRSRSDELGPCDLVVVAKRGISPLLRLADIAVDLDEALASRSVR